MSNTGVAAFALATRGFAYCNRLWLFPNRYSSLEPISRLISKRENEQMAEDKKGREHRPEAQHRCVEDDFVFLTPYAAIWAFHSRKLF